MFENKTIPELQQEYGNLCAKAGEIQYRIHNLKKDLEMVNSTIRDVNFAAAQLQAKEASQEPKAAELKEVPKQEGEGSNV